MLKYLFAAVVFFSIELGFSQKVNSCPNMLYYEAIDLLQKKDTALAQEKLIELYSKYNYGDLAVFYNLYASKSVKSEKLNELLKIQTIQKGSELVSFNNLLRDNRFDTIDINSNFYISNRNKYLSGLDSFMIKELLWMKMRDQLIRNNKEYIDDISKFKHIDSTNLVILQSLIKYNNGKLPSYQQLGSDGSYALEIILTHFDVKNINEIFPYIIEAIKNNTFYNSENVLYQIDRNNIADKNLYLYNKKLKKFDIKKTNKLLHKNIGYCQYYGGMDIYDYESKKVYSWPYFPNRDMNIVNSLLSDLCLPLKNPLKSHIIDCNVGDFIKIALKHM